MADNVDTLLKEKIDEYDFEEHLFENDESKDSFFKKIKEALSPRKIIRYILSNLWKPILVFMLIFSMFLGSVYAGSYYRLFNARTALDFEGTLTQLANSDNIFIVKAIPVIEWTYVTLAGAGDLIQSQIDMQAEARKKQEEETAALLVKEEEETLKAKEETEKAKDVRQKAEEQKPAGPSSQEQEKERQKQEATLRKLAEEQQRELTKRANQLANYYTAMAPQDVVNILKNLENDEIVLILNRMENDAAARILTAFEPARASAISKEILRLHPVPTEVPKNAQGVL